MTAVKTKKLNVVFSFLWKNHRRSTKCHLPYWIIQCYLPPDTGECAPP